MTQEDEVATREIKLEELILNNRRMTAIGELPEVRMCHIEEKDKEKINSPNVEEAVQVQGNLSLRSIVMEVKRFTRYRARL